MSIKERLRRALKRFLKTKFGVWLALVWQTALWELRGRPETVDGFEDQTYMIFCCGLCGRIVNGWDEGGTDDEYCDECWVNAHRDLLERQ